MALYVTLLIVYYAVCVVAATVHACRERGLSDSASEAGMEMTLAFGLSVLAGWIAIQFIAVTALVRYSRGKIRTGKSGAGSTREWPDPIAGSTP